MAEITVQELIDQLRALDSPDAKVMVEGAQVGWMDLKRVVDIEFGRDDNPVVLLSRYE